MDIIIGKLKGESKTTTQAFRYQKDKWSAEEARKHCDEHDGSFEPASESAAFEMSFLAALHSVDAKAKTAKFYLMNTSRNRNGWAVTEKALAEALPTLTNKVLGVGAEYKADKHYPQNEVVEVGRFISFEQPQASYAFGTVAIPDMYALELMQKGDLGPISVVIDAYRVVCSNCHAELKADESALEHKCLKDGSGYEQIESFVFNRVDFIDVPAYPQAGLLELASHTESKAVPIELLAGFYVSQVQPQNMGHDRKKTGENRKMSEKETDVQAKITELTTANATLTTNFAAADKKAKEAETKITTLEAQLKAITDQRHAETVEVAYNARVKAGVAGKPEDEKTMLAKLDDATLKLLASDAEKVAVMATAIAATPKIKYQANTSTDLAAAVKEARAKMGLPQLKEVA